MTLGRRGPRAADGDGFSPPGPRALSRRQWLMGAALGLASCRGAGGEPGVLRIGLVPSVSHAPVLAGLAAGSLAASVHGLRLEARLFRAGPRVVEALIGNAIDIGVTGPGPVVFTFARHGEGALAILSGCASGGASLVVAPGAGIAGPADLHGKALAVTQIANTQDIALRTYLRDHGMASHDHGGDVTIHAFAGAVIKQQMAAGALAGAWLPEPWGTRLVQEIGAIRFLDERALWPERRFASAIVVARGDFVRARPGDCDAFVDAVHAEIDGAQSDLGRTERLSYEEIGRRVGSAGPKSAYHEAMNFVDFTRDALKKSVEKFASDAEALGIMPRVACDALFRQTRA